MKFPFHILTFTWLLGYTVCPAQTNTPMETTHPLLCNPESGICEMPEQNGTTGQNHTIVPKEKSLKIIYFTDPICSSCWGIEPQLRKLKLAYGNNFEIEYRMGGLLPDWSYNSGGISKPSDVAHHWDEVSVYYDMPIDGDVWLEDPLASSYPPSIAFKAAQLQNKEKAIAFLRKIREMVFLQKKNIARWEHLQQAAANVGLDVHQFKYDCENKAKALFNEDLQLARTLGVRGFPTLFFTDGNSRGETVYGSKPYTAFENALLKLLPAAQPVLYDKNWGFLFAKFKTLTAKEFSELSDMPRSGAELFLNCLTAKGILKKTSTKNGAIWEIKKAAN